MKNRIGNEPSSSNQGDDFPEKNRIKKISKAGGASSGMMKTMIILLLIIVLSVTAVLIIVNFVDKKPSFLSTLSKKKSDIESVEKTVPKAGENPGIKKGIDSYSKGFYNDAISRFNEVVESDSSDADKAVALTYIGIIHDERGKHDKAIEFLTRARKYDRDNPDIYKNLSLAFRHKKDYAKAIQSVKKTLELKAEDENAKLLLGNLYYETGEYKKAIDVYNRILKLSPDHPAALYNLASSLLKEGDDFSAAEYFKRAGASDPIGKVGFRSYSRLGALYIQQRGYKKAEGYLRKATSIKPKNAQARYNLGVALDQMGRKEEAIKELTLAEKLGSKDTDLLQSIAGTYFSMKNYDKSLNAYKKILSINKRNVKILSKVAELYYKKGDLDNSFKTYEKITKMEPATENARIAFMNMGNILDDTGRYKEAISMYKKAVTINPADDSTFFNMGLTYKKYKKPELAITAWKKSAELNSNDPASLLAIADLYYEKEAYDLAEKAFQDVLEKWPNLQEAHFKMGSLYYRQGQLEYAKNAFNRVLKISDKGNLARKALINTGIIISRLHNTEESMKLALQSIQKALILKPGDPEALFAMGIVYSRLDSFEKALQTFHQVLKATNDSKLISQTYNNIGKNYYSQKKYRKALQSFSRAVDEDSENEEIRMNRKTAMQAYEAELAGKK